MRVNFARLFVLGMLVFTPQAFAVKMIVYVDYPVIENREIIVESALYGDDRFYTIAYDQRFPGILFHRESTRSLDRCWRFHEKVVKLVKQRFSKNPKMKYVSRDYFLDKIVEESESETPSDNTP